MNAEEIALQRNGKLSGEGWVCTCYRSELHNNGDADPSMFLRDGDVRTVFSCPACGGKDSDLAPLARAKGHIDTPAKMKAKANRKALKPWERPILRTFDYIDKDGNTVFQKVRFADSASSDKFSLRRPDPESASGWRWNIKGITPELYRLPELLKDMESGSTILIAEGERDVDRLRDEGYAATCNYDGGGNWDESYSETLSGQDCVIIPDNDSMGQKHVEVVSTSLQDKAKSIRVVNLPDLPPKGDASDFFDNGGTSDQLDHLLADAHAPPKPAPAPEPKHFHFIHFGSIKAEAPNWLIDGVLEANTLAQIFGDPGSCKSFLALDWAFSIAKGRNLANRKVKQGPVIYIAGEGREGLARRRDAWTLHHLTELTTAPIYLSSGAASLCDEQSAEAVKIQVAELAKQIGAPLLVVVDSLARNFGAGDENSTKDMNAVVKALDDIRSEHKSTVLLVHHTGHADKNRARGSMVLKAVLDAEYRMEKNEDGLIRLHTSKMKDAAFPPPVAFTLKSVDLGFNDEDGNPVSSAVLESAEYVTASKRGVVGKGKNQQKAMEILHDLMKEERAADSNMGIGTVDSKVLTERWKGACSNDGIPRNRLKETFDSLKIAGLIIDVNGDGNYIKPVQPEISV